MQDGRLEIRDPRQPNGRWETQNERGGIEMRDRDERCEIRDARCEVRGARCETWDESDVRWEMRYARWEIRDEG